MTAWEYRGAAWARRRRGERDDRELPDIGRMRPPLVPRRNGDGVEYCADRGRRARERPVRDADMRRGCAFQATGPPRGIGARRGGGRAFPSLPLRERGRAKAATTVRDCETLLTIQASSHRKDPAGRRP